MKKQEGIISKTKLSEWKSEHGAIYRTEMFGVAFIWRPLKRKEFVEVMANKDEDKSPDVLFYERQDSIVEKVVLHPEQEELKKYLENRAGLAGVLSDEIMEKSGFSNVLSDEL